MSIFRKILSKLRGFKSINEIWQTLPLKEREYFKKYSSNLDETFDGKKSVYHYSVKLTIDRCLETWEKLSIKEKSYFAKLNEFQTDILQKSKQSNSKAMHFLNGRHESEWKKILNQNSNELNKDINLAKKQLSAYQKSWNGKKSENFQYIEKNLPFFSKISNNFNEFQVEELQTKVKHLLNERHQSQWEEILNQNSNELNKGVKTSEVELEHQINFEKLNIRKSLKENPLFDGNRFDDNNQIHNLKPNNKVVRSF